MRRTKKAAARISRWPFIPDTSGLRSDKFELNPDIPVTGRTPPTFLLHAENDPVDSVNNSLVYYIALKKAGVPAEMHLYAQGKHAFWTAAHEVSDDRMA